MTDSKVDDFLIEKLKYLHKYVGNETNDWFRIKRELLNLLPYQYRAFFSKRHYVSHKFFINDLEKDLIKTWKEIAGFDLQIDDSRLHKLSDERMPKYWGLMQLNKKRQQMAQEKKNLKATLDEQK